MRWADQAHQVNRARRAKQDTDSQEYRAWPALRDNPAPRVSLVPGETREIHHACLLGTMEYQENQACPVSKATGDLPGSQGARAIWVDRV